jgi:hypothetical protein
MLLKLVYAGAVMQNDIGVEDKYFIFMPCHADTE